MRGRISELQLLPGRLRLVLTAGSSTSNSAPEGKSRKQYTYGTHRVCAPSTTVEFLLRLWDRLGITRLADLTGLDSVGIPVWQAVRPNGWLLSVSQGKGLTVDAAKASALMESVEMWHAENHESSWGAATLGEVELSLGYSIASLALRQPHCLSRSTLIDWSNATTVRGRLQTLVPTDVVRLDDRVTSRWTTPKFIGTTNGLAGGNDHMEAVLHGLYEVVERDALARHRDSTTVVNLQSGHSLVAAGLALESLFAAGVHVQVHLLDSMGDIPCFKASLWSLDLPIPFEGYGCHSSVDVALTRALTEAAQSRVTAIASARDDIDERVHARVRGSYDIAGPLIDHHQRSSGFRLSDVVEFPGANDDIAIEVHDVAEAVANATKIEPVIVDLTREAVGVPVVRVICPGAVGPSGH